MDKLEKLIREKRDHFDNQEPSDKLWFKINGDLDKMEERHISYGNYIWRAAAVVLFAVVIGLLVDRNNDEKSQLTNLNVTNDSEITLNEVEDYYFRVIDQKQNLIKQFIAESSTVDKSLLGEIDQLDSTYRVLKNNLSEINNERIVDAMVLNLQMRIDILNKQLSVLERLQKTDEDETKNI